MKTITEQLATTIESVEDGNFNPLEAYANLDMLEKFVKKCKEQIFDSALEEYGKYGENTIKGRVLTKRGLKEKILAAHRGKVKKVIIPKDNEKDLKEIPKTTLKDMEIVLVDNIDDVIKEAIVTDLPVFQDILITPHPAAIPVEPEFGSNVNLS